jgi:hypothetical protein
VPEPIYTPAEAQALLDEVIRRLAERMVELRAETEPMRRRWQRIVVAIGSNGGGLDKGEAEGLRQALEKAQTEATEILAEIGSHGVQVKDPDTGLLDFPTVVDGRPALLCWRVGEQRIEFWHTLDDGFAGRRPIE